MLSEFHTAQVAHGENEIWNGRVEPRGDGFVVRGDAAGATDLYLAVDGDNVLVSDRLDEMLDHLIGAGAVPSLSSFGISGLLQRGFVPLPQTEFDGIHLLTMGDTARVTWDANAPRVELTSDYPWFTANSRNDGVADEEMLLSLLTKSTARSIEATGGDGLLMLSSGKDSVAIALAVAEAGYENVLCVTYSSGPDDPEPSVAADVCLRLGLKHRVAEMPSDPIWIKATLTRFFSEAPAAGADLAQIPLVMAAAAAETQGGVSLAGDGNDSYMGSLVKRRRALKAAMRIRGRRLAGATRRVIPVDSPLNYLARSKLEAGLPGRMMRFHESRRLLPDAEDVSDYWWKLSKETAHMSSFDAYSIFDKHFTVPSSKRSMFLPASLLGTNRHSRGATTRSPTTTSTCPSSTATTNEKVSRRYCFGGCCSATSTSTSKPSKVVTSRLTAPGSLQRTRTSCALRSINVSYGIATVLPWSTTGSTTSACARCSTTRSSVCSWFRGGTTTAASCLAR